MCIRDRLRDRVVDLAAEFGGGLVLPCDVARDDEIAGVFETCLLYTSDAADERSSVDLGGRRIIKKKKKTSTRT